MSACRLSIIPGMNLIRKITSNGYVPLIPIFAWNLMFASALPPAYAPASFNMDIPSIILTGENVFRAIIFSLPLFFSLNIKTAIGKKGLCLYCVGTVLYFSSWLALMFAPDSGWSTSLLGFAAPAYTPILWLTGIAMMGEAYYFKLNYSKMALPDSRHRFFSFSCCSHNPSLHPVLLAKYLARITDSLSTGFKP